MSDTYPSGATVYLDASVLNDQGAQLPPSVPGEWTCDQGTITQDPTTPTEASVANLPDGTFNAAFTTEVGSIVGAYTAEVGDFTPASVTITGSTTAPAAATPAAA